jgi:hypothetical protein
MNSAVKIMCTRRALFGLVGVIAFPVRSEGFDHTHEPWTRLLSKHVVLRADGNASKVDYAGMASDRAALNDYLARLSSLDSSSFARLDTRQQLAFLINAYNAFTIELILTRYPRLASIKDLGSLWQSPWKKRFFSLLGNETSLDDIENGMLRRPGRFDDPRIHFAINCASIGCPALRPEAYGAQQLDTQLDAQAATFLADRARNRWNPERQRLEVSMLFDWFGDDFRRGFRGLSSPEALFARHADVLADRPADRERIRTLRAELGFLPYDWSLNDVRR